MSFLELVVFVLEIIGTVVFSISGGLVGIERGLDYFGIPVLSMTTAVGGGMLRDLILGKTPPSMFTNPVYVAVAIVTSSLMLLLLHHYGNFVENGKVVSYMGPINFFDSLGLGIFTIIGVNSALDSGYHNAFLAVFVGVMTGVNSALDSGYHNAFLAVFVGVMTGVGGGMLRDIMVRRTPLVLRREIYAVAAIPGALIYYYLQNLLPKTLCMLMCAALIVAIRLISLRFRWNLPNSIEGK